MATTGGRRPGSRRVSQASRDAQDDLRERVDDLDEDLAVEQNLGLDPDELTGQGGLETNSGGRPVIRDNRKVDPVSGRARPARHAGRPATGRTSAGNAPRSGGGGAGSKGTASAAGTTRAPSDSAPAEQTPGTAEAAARALEDEVVAAAELISAREELAVRTEDLQRVAAEYANYRKRVDRDRAVAGDQARAEVLTALIPVLDDVAAARSAGELDGPFKAVTEKLEATVQRFGMERYGQEGDLFDPTIHEALLHQTDPAVTEPKIFVVIQPGYRMDERVLRAARVGVVGQEG
ncbi:MAG: nucleotide exchange factor GrpE [Bifidobacteriaceae bacterium]|jgi:molecular chaperone GrpE|nr:nucleotide exchange factor GrpE [Bifidobacteriaceae bacterium]